MPLEQAAGHRFFGSFAKTTIPTIKGRTPPRADRVSRALWYHA